MEPTSWYFFNNSPLGEYLFLISISGVFAPVVCIRELVLRLTHAAWLNLYVVVLDVLSSHAFVQFYYLTRCSVLPCNIDTCSQSWSLVYSSMLHGLLKARQFQCRGKLVCGKLRSFFIVGFSLVCNSFGFVKERLLPWISPLTTAIFASSRFNSFIKFHLFNRKNCLLITFLSIWN